MAKKKPKPRGDREPELPKFGGFNALAAGLGDLKAKLDAENERGEGDRNEATSAAGTSAASPVCAPTATPESAREDELTFHRMMSGVTPLDGRSTRIAVAGNARIEPTKVTPAELRAKASAEAESVLDHLHQLVDDPVRFEVTDDGRRVEGRRVDVPPQLVRELRRGLLPIDGRLDLHGLGVETARERLLEFLRTMRTRGERCLLVIHGKGDHSPGRSGVLRGEMSAWLSQGRAREHVAAFATAREDDGGEGAIYVALRR